MGKAEYVLVAYRDGSALPVLRVILSDDLIEHFWHIETGRDDFSKGDALCRYIIERLRVACPCLVFPSDCKYYLNLLAICDRRAIDYYLLPVVEII